MMSGDPAGARELAARAGDVRARPRIQDPVRSEVDALNTSATAVAARGLAALDAGRFEDALELLLLSDEWKPGSANVQYNLGVCYLRLGKRERARARFEEAVSIAHDVEALWRLGTLSLEDGDRDLALEQLRLANDRAYEDGPLLARIATGIARAGRPEEALAIFGRATELGPDGAGLRGNWGAALLELGRADEALEQFRRAIDLEPDHPRAYLNAGAAMEVLGNIEGAARFYGEALARDPRGPARQRLDRLARP
jgi:tetratricopeptide (TPR) repeat protein